MRLTLPAVFLALFGFGLAALPVAAHHGFQAEFDGSKLIYITGTLTKFEWENPHTYFWVESKDASGKVTEWTFEGASPIALKRTGTVRGDFTPNIGKSVTVRACPGKDGTSKGAAETIKLSDSRELVVGGKRYTGDGGAKGGGEY